MPRKSVVNLISNTIFLRREFHFSGDRIIFTKMNLYFNSRPKSIFLGLFFLERLHVIIKKNSSIYSVRSHYRKLTINLVCLFQTFRHGFPHQPTALAFDPVQRLLAIGTKSGSLRMYPFAYVMIRAKFCIYVVAMINFGERYDGTIDFIAFGSRNKLLCLAFPPKWSRKFTSAFF